MPQIRLTGLKSGVPIGFMAALGAFRHATSMEELGEVKLLWTPFGGQWCAVLETQNAVESSRIAALFAERVRVIQPRRELLWADAIKGSTAEDLRNAAEAALAVGDLELACWFQCFGSELAVQDRGQNAGKLKSTPFDTSFGSQKFLKSVADLNAELAMDKGAGDAFEEALIGPWTYRDDQHSFGWDQATVLVGAYTAEAPTGMPKGGVRGAVWLAFESLPLFPSFFSGGLATCGFSRLRKLPRLRWCVWETPLSLDAVRILLAQGPGVTLQFKSRMGISEIYYSDVYKPNPANAYQTAFRASVMEA